MVYSEYGIIHSLASGQPVRCEKCNERFTEFEWKQRRETETEIFHSQCAPSLYPHIQIFLDWKPMQRIKSSKQMNYLWDWFTEAIGVHPADRVVVQTIGSAKVATFYFGDGEIGKTQNYFMVMFDRSISMLQTTRGTAFRDVEIPERQEEIPVFSPLSIDDVEIEL